MIQLFLRAVWSLLRQHAVMLFLAIVVVPIGVLCVLRWPLATGLTILGLCAAGASITRMNELLEEDEE